MVKKIVLLLLSTMILCSCGHNEDVKVVVEDDANKSAYEYFEFLNFDYSKLRLASDDANSDKVVLDTFFQYLYDSNFEDYKRRTNEFFDYYKNNCAELDKCSLYIPITSLMFCNNDLYASTVDHSLKIFSDDDVNYLYNLFKNYEKIYKSDQEKEMVYISNLNSLLLLVAYLKGDYEESQKYSDILNNI